MRTLNHFLTDFADQAVILPLVIAIALAMLVQGWRRGAVAWIVATAATFATMLVLKVGFIACSRDHHLHSPSGHVAAASVVAGGLAIMLLRWRPSVVPIAVLAGAVIGISRVVLGMHSLAEVEIGALVGFAGAVGLQGMAGPVPRTVSRRYLILVTCLIVLLMHGFHLPAEARVYHLAHKVRDTLGCATPPLSLFSIR